MKSLLNFRLQSSVSAGMRTLLLKVASLALLLAMNWAAAVPLSSSEDQILCEGHIAMVNYRAENAAYTATNESSATELHKHGDGDQLAKKLGKENNYDAITFLISLGDSSFLFQFAEAFTGPATPELESLIIKHLQNPNLHAPEVSQHIPLLIHKYHSRALFEALLSEIKSNAPNVFDVAEAFATNSKRTTAADLDSNYKSQAEIASAVKTIVSTDLTGIEAELTELLPLLTSYAGREIAKLLVDRQYQPAEPALIDLIRRTPLDSDSMNQISSTAAVVVKLGTPAILDALVRRLVELINLPQKPSYPGEPIKDINKRCDENIKYLVGAIADAPSWVKLNRSLLADKVIQGFSPEHVAMIVAMIKARDRFEEMSDEPTPDDLIYWITQYRNDEVRNYIKRGGDVNAADKSGDRPLNKAAYFSSWDTMRLLLDAGADPRLKSRQGLTPLQIVSGRKPSYATLADDNATLAVAKLLITKGANVSAATPDGQTPLYQATRAKFKKMVELLVENGANVNAESSDWEGGVGMTPTLLADDFGYSEIATYLRSKGGIINYSFVARRAENRAKAVILAPFLGGMH